MYIYIYVRLSVRPYCMSPLLLVLSYRAITPHTPHIFTDSEPPIKWIIGATMRGAFDPPNPGPNGTKWLNVGPNSSK